MRRSPFIVGNASLRSGENIHALWKENGLSMEQSHRSELKGHDMQKDWNLPLGLLNVLAFSAFCYFKDSWTLACVCLTSSAYLVMLKLTSADD